MSSNYLSPITVDLSQPGAVAPPLGDAPLLVRGLGLPTPSAEEVLALLGDARLWAIEPPRYDYVEVPAREYFARFAAGTEHRNIVDSYLLEEHFEPLMPVPRFIEESDLLRGDPRTNHYRRCLVMTPAGAYTAYHADAYGIAGWLYLCEGEKEWEFFRAGDTPALYDPVSNDYYDDQIRPAPPERRGALDALPRFRFTQKAGELVAIPSGAMHRVWTHAPSRGWGGSWLPPSQLAPGLAFRRFELSHWEPGSLDFFAFVDDLCARHPGAPWAPSTRAALAEMRA
jgi:hypothetical protein